MTMPAPRYLVPLIASLLLAACAGTPPATFYTLDDGRPDTAAAGRAATPSVVVTLGELPDTVDRPQLVVRGGDNTVVLSERHRWAAPLRREIPRRVAAALGHLLNSSQVAVLTYLPDNPPPDFRLMIDIQRLDTTLGGAVQLDALWRLQDAAGQMQSGRVAVSEAAAGTGEAAYAAAVAAQDRALQRLAADIAAAIGKQRAGRR